MLIAQKTSSGVLRATHQLFLFDTFMEMQMGGIVREVNSKSKTKTDKVPPLDKRLTLMLNVAAQRMVLKMNRRSTSNPRNSNDVKRKNLADLHNNKINN